MAKKDKAAHPEKARQKQEPSHEGSISKSPAETDLYFKTPHWLRACHNRLMQGPWLRGLILAAILVALGIGTMALGERLFKAPSIAKYLPADETVAYVEFDLDQYDTAMTLAPLTFPWNPLELNERLTAYLPEPSTFLPNWVGNKAGIAWILNPETTQLETWVFLEVEETPTKALPEGKTMADVQNDPDYEKYANEAFFEIDPGHEWYAGDYLVMGPDDPASIEDPLLWDVKEGTHASLKKDPDFMVLRPALSYQPAAFFYMNPERALLEGWFDTWDASLPVWQSDILRPLLALSSVMGLTVASDEGTQGVQLETYWVGEKWLNNDEALFHLDQKYKGTLLEWLPTSVTRFTGGEQLATTFDQVTALLDTLIGTGFLYEALLEQKSQTYFGQNFDLYTDLGPLFDNEYLLLWIEEESTVAVDVNDEPLVAEAPVLLLQLTEETLPHVETLVEDLLNHGLVEVDESTGTVTAASLTLEAREESGIKYNAFTRDDGGEFLQYLVQDNVLIVTTHATEMKTMIDALLGDEETRPSFEYIFAVEEGVEFGDHVRLSSLQGWWGIDQLFSSFNPFDDGMSTWHEIEFE